MESSSATALNTVLTVGALIALFYVVMQHKASRETTIAEGMAVPSQTMPADPVALAYETVPAQPRVDAPAAPSAAEAVQNDCFFKDRLTAEDLLPRDQANETWAQVNPASQGDVGDSNFLSAGYHVGSNTIAGTLRNANLQMRSEPPNPRSRVSVWNESTIEPDLNRRPFEIDGSC